MYYITDPPPSTGMYAVTTLTNGWMKTRPHPCHPYTKRSLPWELVMR